MTFSSSAALAQTALLNESTDWSAFIAALPCGVFTEQGNFRDNARWLRDRSPFGVPFIEWTPARWDVLKSRIRACGNPVVEANKFGSDLHALDAIQRLQPQASLEVNNLLRSREQQSAANARLIADLSRIGSLPAKQQVASLQQLLQHGYHNDNQRSLIMNRLDRARSVASAQNSADQQAAAASAAAAGLAATQQAIEQGKRDAEANHVEIERERAELEILRQQTQAAHEEAEAARQRAAQLQQQQQALAPEQQQLDQQRQRDEAELRQLRQQNATIQQQNQAAHQESVQVNATVLAHTLITRNSAKLAGLEFPPSMLDAIMTFPNGNGGYGPFVTFRQFISVMLANKDVTITGVSGWNDTRQGFSIKRPGAPSSAVLFRQDGNELYLDSAGEGDTIHKLSEGEQMSVALTLDLLYTDTLKHLRDTN